MWDSVPWFIGGGAQHSPEVARLLAYAATSSAEGIVTPGDLKVVPLAVPGSSVRILAGACLIINRAAGGAQQTYVGRNPSEDVKALAATGSGSARNDLIIAQVKDPFMPGEPWATPSDVTKGPYIFSEIVSNVPASAAASNQAATAYLRTKGISGIVLAAVIFPANTATITAGMIRDLRKVAQPRRERFSGRYNITYDPNDAGTTGTWLRYPDVPQPVLDIPDWATQAFIRVDIDGIMARDSALAGWWTVFVGPAQPYGGGTNAQTDPAIPGVPNGVLSTTLTYFNQQVYGDSNLHYVNSDVIAIPATMRGTAQTFSVRMKRGGGTGFFRSTAATQVVLDVEFLEAAV